eukprot:gene7504-9221_t
MFDSKSHQSLFTLIPSEPATYRENKYVESTIMYTLITASGLVDNIDSLKSMLSDGLYITILGGNQFYSQIPQLKERGLPISFEALKSLPPFLPVTGTLQEIQKTGLGSSAALVSSLTAALLSFLKIVDLQNDRPQQELLKDRTLLHNLAQICHCIAQGKIGSGFDISSAVFGSQVYRRFSPEIIQPILKLYDQKQYPNSKELLTIINSNWDNEHNDMALPPGLQLLLADVSIGSNTPVMVKKILEWRKENPTESLSIWTDINKNNENVKSAFTQLHQLYKENNQQYLTAIANCSKLIATEWSQECPITKQLVAVRSSFLEIRRLMRKMGDLADVPLEPIEQTELANTTMDVLGCVASGVPGAGGFDALFAIIIGEESSDQVKNTWMNWKGCQVLPLVLKEEPIGVSYSKI